MFPPCLFPSFTHTLTLTQGRANIRGTSMLDLRLMHEQDPKCQPLNTTVFVGECTLPREFLSYRTFSGVISS